MFACLEPLRVSTADRPRLGPRCSSNRIAAINSTRAASDRASALGREVGVELNSPSLGDIWRSMNMISNAYFDTARRVDWRRLANSKASNPKLPNEQSRTLRDRITNRRIARRTLGRHTGEHRDVAVDIVIDHDFLLGVMKPVKAAGVLRQCSPPVTITLASGGPSRRMPESMLGRRIEIDANARLRGVATCRCATIRSVATIPKWRSVERSGD